MGAVDESMTQLIGALNAWDFSSAYPAGYTGPKAVSIVPGYPPDILPNIVEYLRDQQTSAIVSIESLDIADSYRTLGDNYGPGASGKQRFGTRVELAFTVAAWADQQAGGPDLCRKLAGQVEGCVFYNRVRLTAYRILRTRSGHETYEDRASMWRHDTIVIGSGVTTYDA